ncbi:MAG: EAL domain-containing protein [Methylomonas sp.]|jgi:EAL domain-containing protein (putative c-di-GMP-specific phosphodiesterase class I)/FixJ family two-component response regulator/GGDEF domain-containing protein|uniref:EAL domain-containing protein n=1 Tax=Methylomonas sp. TaxID=418 RepID=UPI0025DED5E1|nr:EAL domain-containing protein [Methylomonas sp.]MCK9605394.1 EAL domain-containing protein [Methylomonas sp.]
MDAIQSPNELYKLQVELERQNQLYAMLSHINRTIVRTKDSQELYMAACRIAVEYGGFALAWVGLINPDNGVVVPVACAGMATVAQLISLHKAETEHQVNASGLNAEAFFIGKDSPSDLCHPSWTSIPEQWGLNSGGSFPIRTEGKIIGVFNVAAKEAGFFREAEINLLAEVVDDISFALEMIRNEEKRMTVETKTKYLVNYDPQTGMPSRTLFEERLCEACEDVGTIQVSVLVVNIRRFHGIVQSLGQDVGQNIIRDMANRLQSVAATLPIARITESNFALILRNFDGLEIAEEFAWQIHRALAEPIIFNEQEFFLDPFIGIACFPLDGEPRDVLKHAMQAAAIQDTSSICRFFFADMDENSRRQLNLDTSLRRALERNEFILHYQPQLDLATGRIIGTEALLRWQSRDYGLVSPQDFIPLLEENGLICAVGEWVLLEACRCNRQWQDQGLPPLRMAVNLSARQFLNGDIQALVKRVLEETGLDPRWLELELTESIVLLNADNVIRTMSELKQNGVTMALDDFGTGYSSLSYLQRLPVARIKIDRSFVTNITSNPGDAAIVRAVVGMAHSLNLTVIAEGVETEGQLGFLRGVGCEEIQGYFFSRPLPEQDFALLLREGRGIKPGHVEKPERVLLLMDDEPNILSALKRALRRKGFRIVSTTNAREGFDLMATHQPGVVLCDQRMPEMTGTEFLRRIKEIYPYTIRMILSGYADLNSVIDAVNQGAVYKFLTKPWEDEALSQHINDAFEIYELHRENRELSQMLQANQTLLNSMHDV